MTTVDARAGRLIILDPRRTGLGTSLHQRWLVHVCRNLIAKVPTHAPDEVKGTTGRSSTRSTTTARPPSPRGAGEPSGSLPSGSRCTPPQSPAWPTTSTRSWSPALPHRASHAHPPLNLIERIFGETRRRVKVTGRLPGEQSCLSLVWAVLDRASTGWRGLTMTPKALRRLQDLRRELLAEPPGHDANEEVVAEPVTTTAAEHHTGTLRPEPFTPPSRRHRSNVRRAGLPKIRLHDVRHSYASAALAAGIAAKVVSERLGHATIAITMDTYSHVLPGLDERAAATVAQLILEGDESASASVDKTLTNGTWSPVEGRDGERR